MDQFAAEIVRVPNHSDEEYQKTPVLLVFGAANFKCNNGGNEIPFPRRRFHSHCRHLAKTRGLRNLVSVWQTDEDLSTSTCILHGVRAKTKDRSVLCDICNLSTEERLEEHISLDRDDTAAEMQSYMVVLSLFGKSRPTFMTRTRSVALASQSSTAEKTSEGNTRKIDRAEVPGGSDE